MRWGPFLLNIMTHTSKYIENGSESGISYSLVVSLTLTSTFWVMQCLWYRQIWINYLSEQLYLLLLYIINMKRQVYWVFINKIVTAMESLLRVFFGRTVCKRKNSAVKMFLPVTTLPSILTSDQINVDYHRVKHKKTSA